MQRLTDKEHAPLNSLLAEGPETGKAHWIVADDNVRLRVAHWPVAEGVKGTVFLFQGRSENLEKYGRTVNALNRQGYSAFAIDWRGQGMSDRVATDPMLSHITSYDDYQIDVDAMVSAANALSLPKPWFILGHSLGACIGLRTVSNPSPFSACAFTAPLWDISLPKYKKIAAWLISWAALFVGKAQAYAPGARGESYVLTNEFEDNRLTHDPEMYEYYVRISEGLPDQQVGGPSMGWLLETLKETKALSALPSPDIPCHTFFGTEDSIVDEGAIKARMASWQNGQLTTIPNARHDLMCETREIRDAIFVAIDELFSNVTQQSGGRDRR